MAAAGGVERVLDDAEVEVFAAAERAPRAPTLPAITPDEIAATLATSGTTSRPKGVLLERRAFLASARAHAANVAPREGDRWLLALPFAHVGGLSILTRALTTRAAVVVLPRFDPEEAARAIAEEHITLASFVPPMLESLLDVLARSAGSGSGGPEPQSRFARPTPASLERLTVLVGGAATRPALAARARELGVRSLATYGMTETCSQLATESPSRAGLRPLEGVELSIAHPDETGRGVIRVRGPMLMRGYVGAPPLAPGAWFETGDVGRLGGDGALEVLGRFDDVIITGGENVDPAEVEAALGAAPGVRSVVVFGLDDPKWGALVAAALVLEEGADLERALERAGHGLAAFKRPRLACVATSLPVNATGKVDRRAARAAFAGALQPVLRR
ncbi:MAG: AMP-binding protein [Polyangiaceae bacterium]